MSNDKKRQQRQAQKKQRRARRLDKAATTSKPATARPTAPLPKLSVAISAFAEPLLDMLGDDPGAVVYEKALMLAAIVWNLELSTRGEAPADIREQLDQLLAEFGRISTLDRAKLVGVCDELARRKRTLFAGDDRIIGDVRVQDVGDGYHVVAMGYSQTPPSV